jgi:hypothetical protein
MNFTDLAILTRCKCNLGSNCKDPKLSNISKTQCTFSWTEGRKGQKEEEKTTVICPYVLSGLCTTDEDLNCVLCRGCTKDKVREIFFDDACAVAEAAGLPTPIDIYFNSGNKDNKKNKKGAKKVAMPIIKPKKDAKKVVEPVMEPINNAADSNNESDEDSKDRDEDSVDETESENLLKGVNESKP